MSIDISRWPPYWPPEELSRIARRNHPESTEREIQLAVAKHRLPALQKAVFVQAAQIAESLHSAIVCSGWTLGALADLAKALWFVGAEEISRRLQRKRQLQGVR